MMQSLDQLIARTENPALATAHARVAADITLTLEQLAKGKMPTTALGGLIMRGRFTADPISEGRTVGQIAGVIHADPSALNDRGDTITDALKDMVATGLASSSEPVDPVDRLLEESTTLVRYKLNV